MRKKQINLIQMDHYITAIQIHLYSIAQTYFTSLTNRLTSTGTYFVSVIFCTIFTVVGLSKTVNKRIYFLEQVFLSIFFHTKLLFHFFSV